MMMNRLFCLLFTLGLISCSTPQKNSASLKPSSSPVGLVLQSPSPSPLVSIQPPPLPVSLGKLPAVAKDNQTLVAQNLRVNQDSKGIALTTELKPNPTGSAKLTHVSVTNGNLFWGHGGNQIELYDSWAEGSVWKYRVCNFDNPLNLFIWDNSHIDQWITQGPNEAAIRLMQVKEAHITGVKFKGYIYDGKHYWKQVVQDRSGGKHYWKNVTVQGPVDIGWMTDPNIPVQTLDLSHWENCTLSDWPSIRAGVKRVEYVNCKIAGQLVNKVIQK